MLDAMSSSTLDHYYDLVKSYMQRYGPSVWMILYQADVRARMDHMERMPPRRQAARGWLGVHIDACVRAHPSLGLGLARDDPRQQLLAEGDGGARHARLG